MQKDKGQKEKTLDLTKGPVAKVLLLFIIPIILGSFIQQLYTTLDAVIVGKFVGKDGLAAIDSMSTLFRFPINFLNGLSAGATIIISQYFGQKNDEELDCSIHTAYTIAILLGIGCSAAGVFLAPWLVRVMAVPEDIYGMTLTYVRIYFMGLWLVTLYNMAAGIIRAFGDSKTPLNILLVCCVVNIVGDLLLVGVFKTGVAGAAFATIASQGISAVLAMRKLAQKHTHCHENIWHLKFCREHGPSMVRLGMPMALQSILFPIANSIVQANVNTMGTDSIAAWAICAKLDLIIWLVADAMSPALSTFVAQNLGAKKKERVTQGTLTGVFSSVIMIAFISLLLFLFSGPLSSLFVSGADAAVLRPFVVRYMRMMAPFYVFYAVAEAFSGACCGMGDTFRSMIITLAGTCGLRVACIFFLLPMARSMETIIFIYIASWIVTGLSFTVLFIINRKKMTASAS